MGFRSITFIFVGGPSLVWKKHSYPALTHDTCFSHGRLRNFRSKLQVYFFETALAAVRRKRCGRCCSFPIDDQVFIHIGTLLLFHFCYTCSNSVPILHSHSITHHTSRPKTSRCLRGHPSPQHHPLHKTDYETCIPPHQAKTPSHQPGTKSP